MTRTWTGFDQLVMATEPLAFPDPLVPVMPAKVPVAVHRHGPMGCQ
jgi:hypothetical protein